MAEEEPDVPNTDRFTATEVMPSKTRKPFWKDPLSIIGWGIALGSIVAYWYFFVRQHVPEAGEQVARITSVAGTVRVKPNEQEVWKDAVLQDLLHVGDVVQTEPASGAAMNVPRPV